MQHTHIHNDVLSRYGILSMLLGLGTLVEVWLGSQTYPVWFHMAYSFDKYLQTMVTLIDSRDGHDVQASIFFFENYSTNLVPLSPFLVDSPHLSSAGLVRIIVKWVISHNYLAPLEPDPMK